MTQRLSIHRDNSELENYKAIVEVVCNVDWNIVHKCMELLDWKWALGVNGVPSELELINQTIRWAEEYVQKSIDNKRDYHTSCGGIGIRTKYFPEGDIALTVQFVLTEWDNYL